MPIRLTDPDALRMLAMVADMLGLLEAGKGVRPDERTVQSPGGGASE